MVGVPPLRGQIQFRSASLFLYGGGYRAVHDAFNLTTGTTDDFKTGFDLGGGVGFEIHKYLEVRATLTGAQSHLRVNGAATGVYLNRYYVAADLKAQYPSPSGLTPYGLAGGGVVILHEKSGERGEQDPGLRARRSWLRIRPLEALVGLRAGRRLLLFLVRTQWGAARLLERAV